MDVVLHHSADFDGLFIAAVCKKFLAPETVFIGWDYGDPTPTIPEGVNELYMVDISIPDLMAWPGLIWIDHHKSAIEKYGDVDNGSPITYGFTLDGVAACRLCWSYFTNRDDDSKEAFVERRVAEPQILRLVGEYDVWDLRDPDAMILQYGLVASGVDTVDKCLAALEADDVVPYLHAGQAAYTWQQNFATQVFKDRSYIREWEGLRFCILASCHTRNSTWFPTEVLPDVDALMAWRYNGKMVEFSLYHHPDHKDIDLSVIAAKWGGGGHRGACGFRMSLDEALPIIQ